MPNFYDAVNFLATSSGTGDFVVASAIQGYRTPLAAAVPNGATSGYYATSTSGNEWELGITTYATGTVTAARTTVITNHLGSTAKVNFTAPPNVGFVELSRDMLGFDFANSFTTAQKVQALQNIGALFNNNTSVGSITLGASHVGVLCYDNAAGVTVTIPAASAFPQALFCLVHQATGTLTVARTGTDQFFGPGGWGVNSLSLAIQGSFVVLQSSGAAWDVVGGSPDVLGGVSFAAGQALTTAQKVQAQSNIFVSAPTTQSLTSGTTYTPTSTNVKWIEVFMYGGGGGAGGSGTASSGAGGTGGTTTFNSVTAVGGAGGGIGNVHGSANPNAGGLGGTGGTGTANYRAKGGAGTASSPSASGAYNGVGGTGGDAPGPFGGAGTQGSANTAGPTAGVAGEKGAGGGGGSGPNAGVGSGGAGGGSGEYVYLVLPYAASYAYAIGAAGAAGTAGTGGAAGGAGGPGYIFVVEHYS